MNVRHSVSLLTIGLLASVVSGASAATHTSFVPNAVTAAGTHAVGFSVGDFNGDGKADLVVVNRAYHAKIAVVLLGHGDGSFAQPVVRAKLGETPERVFTGDVNGDGHLDAIVRIGDDPEVQDEHVAILLGDGTGGLRPGPGSPVDFLELAGVSDVNGDHKPDLIGFADNDTRIAIGLGDGIGRFASARTVATGSRFAVADFNGDGLPDLIAGGEKNLSILLGTGSARFGTARGIGSAAGGLSVAEFNGDGKLDLAVAGKTLAILLGDGAGGFRSPGSPVKEALSTFAPADVNGDGKTDLAATEENKVVTLLGDGTGRFHRVVSSRPLPFYPQKLAVTDTSADGTPELIAAARYGSYSNEGPDADPWLIIALQRAQVGRRPQIAKARAPRHVEGMQFAVHGAIERFAADDARAAVMATGGAGGHCARGDQIVVWNAAGHSATKIGRVPTPRCTRRFAPDSGVNEFALGGDSVAWITGGSAGNTEGWQDVYAAKLPAGKVRRIGGGEGREDYDASGGWVGHLRGGGSVLAYNEWGTACDGPDGYGCSASDLWFGVTDASLVRIAGARRVVTKRGLGGYRLAAAGGGLFGVIAEDGSITVLAPSGARVSTVPANGDLVLSVALSRTRLAVMRWSHTLDLYDVRGGGRAKSLPLPLATRTDLAGVNDKLALLGRPGHFVLVRLSDGRSIALNVPPHLAGAALTERGLFYAYNVPRAGGRIAFEPNAALLKRF